MAEKQDATDQLNTQRFLYFCVMLHKTKMRFLLFTIITSTLLLVGCKKKITFATVSTAFPVESNINTTSAILEGSITKDGNSTVTERGIVVGTSSAPSISSVSNMIFTNGSGLGDFSVSATGLSPGTTYHFRAYATNSVGTSYGEERSFLTVASPEIFCGDSITIDCLNTNWAVQKPSTASYSILPNYYLGKNCLLLVNSHGSTQVNPPSIQFNSVINNIKRTTSYRISCDVKIKGYPDFANNPSFAFYAFTSSNWYGQHYFNSSPGAYEISDWSNHSYIFISGEETSLQFQLYSLYDSTWISNLAITEL